MDIEFERKSEDEVDVIVDGAHTDTIYHGHNLNNRGTVKVYRGRRHFEESPFRMLRLNEHEKILIADEWVVSAVADDELQVRLWKVNEHGQYKIEEEAAGKYAEEPV